jgi:hypothetical protein
MEEALKSLRDIPECRQIKTIALPRGATLKMIKALYEMVPQQQGDELFLADRTLYMALRGRVPERFRTLDDIFGSALRSLLLQSHGPNFLLSPDECPGADDSERSKSFASQMQVILPELLRLGFPANRKRPDQVVIFTDSLADHAPFYFIEKLIADPGIFLKESLVKIGIPADSITVVRDPGELLLQIYPDRDPLIDVMNAKRVVFFGDRHALSNNWVRKSIIGGIALSDEERGILEGAPNSNKRASGKSPRKTDQLPTEEQLMYQTLHSTLKIFGNEEGVNSQGRTVIWLRFPIENLLVDFTRQKMIAPKLAIEPLDLVPGIVREIRELASQRQK